MRRHSFVLLALAAAGLLSIHSPRASALPAAKRNQQAGAYTNQINNLRAVRQVLQNANHDYKGHRAKAVHQISSAIHALHGGAKSGKGKGKATGAKVAKRVNQGAGKAVREPQALSDAQLRDAIAALQATQTQLAGAGGPGAAKAVPHIGNAIKELGIALTIK
jgi:hypothetical protein